MSSHTHKRQKLNNKDVSTPNATSSIAFSTKLSLDVLLEIFGWLAPLDLLTLARTGKQLRAILMSKISRLSWKTSLKNTYDMPDCPPDLSEPQYAFLLAVNECHDCEKTGIRAVDWALRVRWCPSCANKHYITKDEFADFKYNITDLLPRSVVYRFRFCYSKEQVTKLREKLIQLEGNPADVEALFKEQRELTERIALHAKQCQSAAEKENKRIAEEKKQSAEERQLELRSRLMNSSPEVREEVEHLTPVMFSRLPGIKTKSDKAWERQSSNLLSTVLELKPQRIRQERTAMAMKALKRYKLPLLISGNTFKFLPSVADFCRFPEVEALLNKPLDATVAETDFEEILEPTRFAPIHMRWLDEIQTSLYRSMFDSREGSHESATGDPIWSHEEGVRRLKLATTIFQCSTCGPSHRFTSDGKSMQFPLVVAHPCLRREPIHHPIPIYWDKSTRLRTSDKIQRRPWACDLTFDRETGVQIIAPIVRASGFDPETATIEDMDKADPWLICRICSPSSEQEIHNAYGWKEAIEHGETHKSEQNWQALSSADASTIRLIQECLPPELEPSSELREMAQDWTLFTKDPLRQVWRCAICCDTPEEHPDSLVPMSMVYHLRNKHNIQYASPQYCFKAPMTPLRLAGKPIKVRSFQLPDQEPRYGVLVPRKFIRSEGIFKEAQALKSVDGGETVLQLTSLPEKIQKKYQCQSGPLILQDI